MAKKEFKTVIEFITEQNRFERTGGLDIDHPNGGVVPWDVPLSSKEVAFWAREEEEYQKMLQANFDNTE